jgi:hypothetical protein
VARQGHQAGRYQIAATTVVRDAIRVETIT